MRLKATADLLRSFDYPATRTQLIDDHGDHVIELPRGDETLGAVLDRVDWETYERSEDVVNALYTGVGHRAIGRRFYGDRDAFTPGERGPDPVSF